MLTTVLTFLSAFPGDILWFITSERQLFHLQFGKEKGKFEIINVHTSPPLPYSLFFITFGNFLLQVTAELIENIPLAIRDRYTLCMSPADCRLPFTRVMLVRVGIYSVSYVIGHLGFFHWAPVILTVRSSHQFWQDHFSGRIA